MLNPLENFPQIDSISDTRFLTFLVEEAFKWFIPQSKGFQLFHNNKIVKIFINVSNKTIDFHIPYKRFGKMKKISLNS